MRAPSVARDRGQDYAIYVNVEQELWREPGSESQGLGAFAHCGCDFLHARIAGIGLQN